jgi:hypothetical protein
MTKMWWTADGEKEYLDSEEFLEIFNKFKEKLAKYDIVVKQFENDPNCTH